MQVFWIAKANSPVEMTIEHNMCIASNKVLGSSCQMSSGKQLTRVAVIYNK